MCLLVRRDQQTSSEFWDETIWEMRDRKRDADAFYPEDSYYGIKGIRRQSNGTVAIYLVLSVIIGCSLYFLFALQLVFHFIPTRIFFVSM